MTAPWNKLIPLQNLGLPFHGLIENDGVNNVLTLPNGETKNIPAFNSNPNLVLRSPTAPGARRTILQQQEDALNGREYRDYALVTQGGWIGGTALESNGNPARIYIDPAGTPWLIELDLGFDGVGLTDNYTGTITIKLASLFGRFAQEPYAAIDRTLQTLAVDFDDGTWLMGTGASRWRNPHYGLITHNETGSGIKVCYYTRKETGVGQRSIATFIASTDIYLSARLEAILSIDISGTGSTERATLGDGISATISLHREDNESNRLVDESYSLGPYRFDYSEDPGLSGCPINAVADTKIATVNKLVTTYRLAQVYVGNDVRDIKTEQTEESCAYVEQVMSGTFWCCDGVGGFPVQTDTADGYRTLHRLYKQKAKLYRADNTTVEKEIGYDLTSEDITGDPVVTTCCNCQLDGVYSWNIREADTWPDAPDYSNQPGLARTAVFYHGVFWLPGINGGDSEGTCPSANVTTALTVSTSEAPWVATNPETNEVTVSENPAAYV